MDNDVKNWRTTQSNRGSVRNNRGNSITVDS